MHLFSIAVALLAFVGSAVAQDASPDALKDLAPTGKLRAAINLGNGVLAQKDPASCEPSAFVEDMKTSGFVADALKRRNQSATVAPPAK